MMVGGDSVQYKKTKQNKTKHAKITAFLAAAILFFIGKIIVI